MIIQYNLVYDARAKQLGHKLFYHWNIGTVPTDQEVVDVLEHRYKSGFRLGIEQERSHINIVTSYFWAIC